MVHWQNAPGVYVWLNGGHRKCMVIWRARCAVCSARPQNRGAVATGGATHPGGVPPSSDTGRLCAACDSLPCGCTCPPSLRASRPGPGLHMSALTARLAAAKKKTHGNRGFIWFSNAWFVVRMKFSEAMFVCINETGTRPVYPQGSCGFLRLDTAAKRQ